MPYENSLAVRAEAILGCLNEALPAERPIWLHEPEINADDRKAVDACLASGWISSAGPEVARLERTLSEFTGIPNALATVNGTSAVHLALLAAGVRAQDEVLSPALTFVGTVNPIAYQGAYPHFVDCDEATLGVDPERLDAYLSAIAVLRPEGCFNRRTGRRIRAMIVVHVLGTPARMPELHDVARRWRLKLIEDAAEALGSRIDGRHVGHWADCCTLSFNGNKIISAGGGGALLCHDKDMAAFARHLGTTAKLHHPWALEHDQVAYNYRMPNLNAALALSQMERLSQYLEAKRRLHQRYSQAFSKAVDAVLYQPPADRESNHWLDLLLVSPEIRDAVLHRGMEEQIHLRPFWTPLHRLPMFQRCPRDRLPVTESLFERGICLPGSPELAG